MRVWIFQSSIIYFPYFEAKESDNDVSLPANQSLWCPLQNNLKSIVQPIAESDEFDYWWSWKCFFLGRLIIDNAIIAFEVFHSINISLSKRDPHMALKLYTSKAFDCVEWGFLEILLQKMGFLDQFRCLVMSCITIAPTRFFLMEFLLGVLYLSRVFGWGTRSHSIPSSYV